MPNQYFRFKQFAIRQERSAMKVGTDGVLLGAWVNTGEAKRILDVGTGTGLIALMMAQRCNAIIDAVEIDEPSANQAKDNVETSRWSDRVSIYQEAFQDFASKSTQKYDLIVSNPPYFIKSLKPPEVARTVARHTDQLPYSDLLLGISKLLAKGGRFAGIFPYVEGNVFVAEASVYGLYCSKRVSVLGKTQGTVKRILLEFSQEKIPLVQEKLAIRDIESEYSTEYINLTKDFYLAF
jgi:tRNA1Val (adenine37-N6)-methyltransferase